MRPRYAIAGLLLATLAACGGGDETDCPVVTPENVHLMTGDVPPGSPCAQVLAAPLLPPTETITYCIKPLDPAEPELPCQWNQPQEN